MAELAGSRFASRLAAIGTAAADDVRLGHPEAMRVVLQQIRRQHGLAETATVTAPELEPVAAKLRASSRLTWQEARLAAFGTAVRLNDGSRIGDELDLVRRLLGELGAHSADNPRRRRRAFAGILNAYFLEPQPDEPGGLAAWRLARAWLDAQLDGLPETGSTGEAIAALKRHRNLLTDQPCRRYGAERDAVVDELRTQIDVPVESWIFDDVLLARVETATGLADAAFAACIEPLVKRLAEVPRVEERGIATLLQRYVRGATPRTPEVRLQAESVRLWGSPLAAANRPRWDAHAGAASRAMVGSWLKRRAIELFFELLAGSWAADPQRTQFWLRYVEHIEPLYLLLGNDSFYSRAREYRDLKTLLSGNYARLDGDADNNGIVMVIGGYAFVEFVASGNACYVYPADRLPFAFDGKAVSIQEAKNRGRAVDWLTHHQGWQRKFAATVSSLTGVRG